MIKPYVIENGETRKPTYKKNGGQGIPGNRFSQHTGERHGLKRLWQMPWKQKQVFEAMDDSYGKN